MFAVFVIWAIGMPSQDRRWARSGTRRAAAIHDRFNLDRARDSCSRDRCCVGAWMDCFRYPDLGAAPRLL